MNYSRAGVIIKKDNAYLLMKRIKNQGRLYYAVLGGRPEIGETPGITAIREIQEESGLVVTLHKTPIIIDDGVYQYPEYYFWADTISGTPELGGEEKEFNNPQNVFELEWIDEKDLASITLMPKSLHTYLIHHKK